MDRGGPAVSDGPASVNLLCCRAAGDLLVHIPVFTYPQRHYRALNHMDKTGRSLVYYCLCLFWAHERIAIGRRWLLDNRRRAFPWAMKSIEGRKSQTQTFPRGLGFHTEQPNQKIPRTPRATHLKASPQTKRCDRGLRVRPRFLCCSSRKGDGKNHRSRCLFTDAGEGRLLCEEERRDCGVLEE